MDVKTLEAFLSSPAEREALVVQLFLRDGGQWGEIFKDKGKYWLELYEQPQGQPWLLDFEEVLKILQLSIVKLKDHQE